MCVKTKLKTRISKYNYITTKETETDFYCSIAFKGAFPAIFNKQQQQLKQVYYKIKDNISFISVLLNSVFICKSWATPVKSENIE